MRSNTPDGKRLPAATWALLALAGLGSAQQKATDAPAAESRTDGEPLGRIALEGFVVDAKDNPAPGVVVVSSAGGRTVTDAAGSYRLELEAPPQATSVQLTAVGSAGTNTLASVRVALAASAGTIRVDPLRLTRGPACVPDWVPTFGGIPGTDEPVLAMTTFDDGHGPALYVGGNGIRAADQAAVQGVARWDGSGWAALGRGMTLGQVSALTVFDDGRGSALYAGGAGASNLMRWNGSSSEEVGGGTNGSVRALAVFDDGHGPALYVGGTFTSAGGLPAQNIARWNGSSWAALGSGVSPGVRALAVFDDGTGPALYVGGDLRTAGGAAASGIARWDGSSWTTLARGLNGNVYALAVFDDGGGQALYAGGTFTRSGRTGSTTLNRIARWKDSTWTALGNGVDSYVAALSAFDDGSGPALYAGGFFRLAGGVVANGIAKWGGSDWEALGAGLPPVLDNNCYALTDFDDGTGPALYVGGTFIRAGSASVKNIAKWDGSDWERLGGGLDGQGMDLATFDLGGQSALYVAGNFTTTREVAANRIAKWDGSHWEALGGGMDDTVMAMAVFDDGRGPGLYAGGRFSSADGLPANHIARWDGSSWTSLGSGLSYQGVQALTVFDDGAGPALYAGGVFELAGGLPANNVAKWDGASWTAVGSGLSGGVRSLIVFDDGGGPALYAGGSIGFPGELHAINIARWDGSSWSALGSGVYTQAASSFVNALAVFDDGGGPALYAGGRFDTAGVLPASNMAKWDGSSWTPVGGGLSGDVKALTVFDDGSGPALHAGGGFHFAGGVLASFVAKWDGSSWAALGSGLDPLLPGLGLEVAFGFALEGFDDGSGPALYVGGLTRWGCPAPDTTPPVLRCPLSITVTDHGADGPGEVVRYSVVASDDRDPLVALACVPPSGSVFPPGTTRVTCTARDTAGNTSTCEFPVTVQP